MLKNKDFFCKNVARKLSKTLPIDFEILLGMVRMADRYAPQSKLETVCLAAAVYAERFNKSPAGCLYDIIGDIFSDGKKKILCKEDFVFTGTARDTLVKFSEYILDKYSKNNLFTGGNSSEK